MIDPEALAQLLADLAFPSGNKLGLTLDDMQTQLPTHCRVIAGHLCDDAEARGRLVATLLGDVSAWSSSDGRTRCPRCQSVHVVGFVCQSCGYADEPKQAAK